MSTCTLVRLYSCTLVLLYYFSLVPLYPGTLVPWYPCTLVRLYSCTLQPGNSFLLICGQGHATTFAAKPLGPLASRQEHAVLSRQQSVGTTMLAPCARRLVAGSISDDAMDLAHRCQTKPCETSHKQTESYVKHGSCDGLGTPWPS